MQLGGGDPYFYSYQRQRQVELCEFEASLIYKASSRITRAVIQRNSASENKKQTTITKNPKMYYMET